MDEYWAGPGESTDNLKLRVITLLDLELVVEIHDRFSGTISFRLEPGRPDNDINAEEIFLHLDLSTDVTLKYVTNIVCNT